MILSKRWSKSMLSLLLLIWIIQVGISPLDRLSEIIMVFFQNTIPDSFHLAFMVIVFIFIKLILTKVFLFQSMVVRPKVTQTMSNAVFFAGAMFLMGFLSLLFGEYTPTMNALLNGENLTYYSCTTGFAIPAAEVYLLVSLYNLYKFNFFRSNSSKSYERYVNEQDEHFWTKLMSFQKAKIEFGDCKYPIMGRTFTFSGFKKLVVVILAVVTLQNMSDGSAYLRQIIMAIFVGHLWAHVYFYYLQDKIKGLFHDLIIVPNSRRLSVRIFNILSVLCLTLLMFLYAVRKTLQSSAERTIILGAMAADCKNHLYFEDSEIYFAVIFIVPVVMVNLLFCSQTRPKIFTQIPERKSYFDFMRTEKIARAIFIFTPIFTMLLLNKLAQFTLIRVVNYHLIPIYAINICVLLYVAIHVTLIYPFILYKRNLLLPKEYIFAENNSGLSNSSRTQNSSNASGGYEDFDEEIRPSDVEEEKKEFETPRQSLLHHTNVFLNKEEPLPNDKDQKDANKNDSVKQDLKKKKVPGGTNLLKEENDDIDQGFRVISPPNSDDNKL